MVKIILISSNPLFLILKFFHISIYLIELLVESYEGV